MVIFHSYVSLPEGNPWVKKMYIYNIFAVKWILIRKWDTTCQKNIQKTHKKKQYGTDLRCKLIGGLCFPEQWECRDDNSKSEANLPRLGYDQHWLRKAHYPVASSHYLNFNPPTLMIKSWVVSLKWYPMAHVAL
jgi:hypothetical protein